MKPTEHIILINEGKFGCNRINQCNCLVSCKCCSHAQITHHLNTNRVIPFASPLSRLKSAFPSVHYHPALTEDDDDWRPDARETREDVSQRIHNFFVWLMQQPHSNVAIVTHGVWMECALLNYCPEALEFGKKRVFNCDVYSGTLMGSLEQNSVVLRDVEKVHLA